MSFVERMIGLRFELGTGAFGEDGSNVVEFAGLRCSANIDKAGGVFMTKLDLRVWGLPLDVMAKLTVLNQLAYTSARLNTVTVSAGDKESGMSVCFVGIISEAWADMRSAPEGVLHLAANTGLLDKVRPVPAISFNGTIDAVTVLRNVCAQMAPPLSVENNGVTAQLSNTYLPGTAMDQLQAVCRQCDFEYIVENDTLAIWPKGGSRDGLVPLISADTGMVGYPEFTQNGIRLTTLYNPGLTFGRKVEVRSTLQPACGYWVLASVNHNLDAQMPGGQWFTQIEGSVLGHEVPIV